MPGLDELEWAEYKDFTGGLWQRGNDRECAPNGLLEATDCFPQSAGGLRAFAQFQPIRTTFPATTPQTAWVIGIWSAKETADPTHHGLYCLTIEGTAAPFTLRGWHLFTQTPPQTEWPTEANLAGSAAWTQVFILSNVTDLATGVRAMTHAATGLSFHINIPTDTGTSAQGIWGFDRTTSSLFINTAANEVSRPIGMNIHQDRLMWIGSFNFAESCKSIIYTDAGSSNVTTNNFITPIGATPTALRFLAPYSPSDLVTMKMGHSLIDVQGDITGPTVREMGFTHLRARGFPIQTDVGLVMVISNEGAYSWNGNGLDPISKSIRGDAMGGPLRNSVTDTDQTDMAYLADLLGGPLWGSGPSAHHHTGQLGCYENWVFFNNGYVLDTRTNAWFTQTSVPGGRYWTTDYTNRRVHVSTNAMFSGPAAGAGPPSPDVMFYSRMGESSWIAMSTYSWTLPLIYAQGQQTNLRQLEYHIQTYNDVSSVAVEITFLDNYRQPATLTLPTPEVTLPSAAPHRVVFDIPGHPSDWYKVRTILKSNRPGVEAPTLEKMFTGTQKATRYGVNRGN